VSWAALETIGYGYHIDGSKVVKNALIWDKDIDVVWMDYSNPRNTWGNQDDWAGGLDAEMFVELLPGYSVTWDDSQWRLPDAHNQDGTGPSSGYNVTTSEMGHLFYEKNVSEFTELKASWYWSGTEYADNTDDAWNFFMPNGYQDYDDKSHNYYYGLAVRSGQVSAVPVPGAIWLLGSGLAGLTVLKRKKKNRV